MSSNAMVSPIRGDVMDFPLPCMAAAILVLCPENSFDKSCALTCATPTQLHPLHLSVIYGTAH